jgi:hypothetical protein
MYMDRFDYSWGQYLARMAGCTVHNFSRGGMTAKEYNENFGNAMGHFRPELAANAYIIALGVNDLLNRGMPTGSVADICLEDWRKNADSFAGHYGAIIQRYKKIRPEAKFFLINFPANSNYTPERKAAAEAHDALLRELCKLFSNTYLIDLRNHAPDFGDADFRKRFYLGGHMAPAGYLFFAKLVSSVWQLSQRLRPCQIIQPFFRELFFLRGTVCAYVIPSGVQSRPFGFLAFNLILQFGNFSRICKLVATTRHDSRPSRRLVDKVDRLIG